MNGCGKELKSGRTNDDRYKPIAAVAISEKDIQANSGVDKILSLQKFSDKVVGMEERGAVINNAYVRPVLSFS